MWNQVSTILATQVSLIVSFIMVFLAASWGVSTASREVTYIQKYVICCFDLQQILTSVSMV